MKRILVIGSLNMDLVTHVHALPQPGETISSLTFQTHPGGKGANQAVAAAKLGADVTMIGKVGADDYGLELIRGLQDAGVKTDAIERTGDTGKAFITVSESGENTIVLVPGANHQIRVSDIESQKQVIEASDIVILQLEIPLEVVDFALFAAAEFGKQVILNPAPAQKLSDELLSTVHTVILNETELEILTDMPTDTVQNAMAAAEHLKTLGSERVILTLGGQGSYLINAEGQAHIPAVQVQPVDTTAAGDSYIGAFAVGLTNGMNDREAAEFASKVAAMVVTREGAQPSLPTMQEVESWKK